MQRLIRDLIAATGMVAISYVGATFAHAEDTLSKIRDTQTITLAYRESSMPFSYLDDNKKPIGFALDLCLEIADAVKRELKLSKLNIAYVPVTSSNRIQAIVDGKADLECGSSTNDAERRKKVAFTIPHFIAASKMLVRADSGIKNWTDLHDKKIVMTKGTTPVKLLLDRDKVRDLHLTVVEGRDHGDSFAMIEKGQVNAFAMHDAMLYGLRANAANPDSFNIVGDPLS